MKYCENTESCNDMLPLTQYKETLQASLQAFSKSSSVTLQVSQQQVTYSRICCSTHCSTLLTANMMLENQQMLQLQDHKVDTMILQEKTSIYNINLSQQLNSIKLSQASSCFKCLTHCSTT